MQEFYHLAFHHFTASQMFVEPYKGQYDTFSFLLGQEMLVLPISLADLPLHPVAFHRFLEIPLRYTHQDLCLRMVVLYLHIDKSNGKGHHGTTVASRKELVNQSLT